MTCHEAERLVTSYIKGTIGDRQLEAFLKHIENCSDCMDELETYYIVETGIRQLDSDAEDFNIKGSLEQALLKSRHRLQVVKSMLITKYAVNTLIVMSILITLILQLRIWAQNGFIR